MSRPFNSRARAYPVFLYRDGRVAFWPMTFETAGEALAHVAAWRRHQSTLPSPDPLAAASYDTGVWAAALVGEQTLRETLRIGAFKGKAA
jgi:hypothetical protein